MKHILFISSFSVSRGFTIIHNHHYYQEIWYPLIYKPTNLVFFKPRTRLILTLILLVTQSSWSYYDVFVYYRKLILGVHCYTVVNMSQCTILIFKPIDLLLYMNCNWQNAYLAFLVLALLSFAVPLVLLSMLRKYVKSSTSSIMLIPKNIGCIVLLLMLMILVSSHL